MASIEDPPGPDYSCLAMTGPSHCPTFTMICQYKGYVEESSGRTKKEAKNLAAEKMYHRFSKESKFKLQPSKLQNYFETFPSTILHLKSFNEKEMLVKESSKKAFEKYSALRKTGTVKATVDTKKPLSEYFLHLKKNLGDKEYGVLANELLRIIDDCKCFTFNNPEKELENCLKTLNINLNRVQYRLKQNGAIYGLKLSTIPVISEIGYGITQKEAEMEAVAKITKTLLLMLI